MTATDKTNLEVPSMNELIPNPTMKTILLVIVMATLIPCALMAQSGGVALNESNDAPNASAILDMSSNTKGALIPRMTQSQRLSIPLPTAGLTVFQTNNIRGLWVYNGSIWSPVSPLGVHTGDIRYWNGSQWVMIPVGSPGQYLQLSDIGLPTWMTLTN